jgi:hypothetical protein
MLGNMKFKDISVSNCRFLLPGLFDMRILRDFDWYLEEVDNSKEHSGVIIPMENQVIEIEF